MIIDEYIWLGGRDELRSKTKTYKPHVSKAMHIRDNFLDHHNYPFWNYDGSSTEQAVGNDSEVIIKPVAIFDDPFNEHSNTIHDTPITTTVNNLTETPEFEAAPPPS